MPFDSTPSSEAQQETRPDPFTLEALIAWLEKQPPETDYNWMSGNDCLLCRYLKANDIHFINYKRMQDMESDSGWRVASAVNGPTTYGAALSRARVLLAARSGRER
jgi:hypothetical protein